MALTKVTGHVVLPTTNIEFHNTKSTGIVTFTDTTQSTSVTTGGLQVAGGVGIAKNLNVGGNLNVTGNLTYTDVDNINSVGIITANSNIEVGGFIKHLGNTSTMIGFPSDNNIQFKIDNVEKFRVDSSGNVGVNTNNPHSELEVFSDTFADITVGSARTSGNIGGINFRKTNPGGAYAGIMTAQYFVDTSGSHLFHSQGSERLKIASDGDLTITGSDNAELKLKCGTSTGDSVIAFLNSSGTTKGNIFYDSDNNFMVFKTNGTGSSNERLRINSTGHILKGHTAASADLHDSQTTTGRSPRFQLHGAEAVTAGLALVSWKSGTGSYYSPNIYLARSGSDTKGTNGLVTNSAPLGAITFNGDDGGEFAKAAVILGEVDGTSGADNMPGRLIFKTTPSGTQVPLERLRIASDGDVSIGSTTDALRRVDVVGNSLLVRPTIDNVSSFGNASTVNNSIIIRMPYGENPASTNHSGARFGIQFTGANNTTDVSSLNFGNDPVKSASIYAISEDNLGYNRKIGLSFYTSGFDAAQTEKLRIANDGTITHTNFDGIGLHMSGGQDPTIRIQDTDGTNQYVDLAHNGGDSYVLTRNNTTHGEFLIYSSNGSETKTRFKVRQDGNVGINTGDPQNDLDVYGNSSSANGPAPIVILRNGASGIANQSNALKTELRVLHANHNDAHEFMASRIITETTDNYMQRTYLRFLVANANNGTEMLTIDPYGHVGITTSSPSNSLTVAADSASAIIELKRTNTNTTGSFGALSWTAMDGHSVANLYAVGDGNNEGAHLVFRTTSAAASNDPYNAATVERLRITSGGVIQTSTRSASVRRMILSGSPTNSAFNIEAHDGATGTSANTNQGEIGLYYNDGSTLSDEAAIKFYRGTGAGDGYFGFNTGANERLRINREGQIIKRQDPVNRTSLKSYSGEGLYFDHYQLQVSSTYRRYADIASVGDGSWGSILRLHTMPDSGSATERVRIDQNGRVLINSTAVVNSDDFLTIKRPAGSNAVTSMTLDASNSTSTYANALIFTKAKDYYYNGLIFTSSEGHQGGICGKMTTNGGSTPQIDLRIGGSSFNQSDTLAMTVHNSGNIDMYGYLKAKPSSGNGDNRLAMGRHYTWNQSNLSPDTSAGLESGWYPIMDISDGQYLFLIGTNAHNSATCLISNGYDPSAVSRINILNCVRNNNGSYLNINEIRVLNNGIVEVYLYASSPTYFGMYIQMISNKEMPNFYSTLTKNTGSPTVDDSKDFYTYSSSVGSGLMHVESLRVDGTLSKSSGSFTIPHPLTSKKDTHHLNHSFIEGPQCDNIYRGKVTLSSGAATVNLDTVSNMTEGTFVLLNRDVQCFTTNETGWGAVKGSVSGNILTISAQDGSSTDTISWMVIGERQDDTVKSLDMTDDNGDLIVEKDITTNVGLVTGTTSPYGQS